MPETPDITFKGDQESGSIGAGGIEIVQAYDIHAASMLDAISKLRQIKNIYYQSVMRTPYGEAPTPALFCQGVEFPSPPRIAPVGGTGIYTAVCTFSQKQGGGASVDPEPIAGGPAKYRWRASLKTTRATVDRNGVPITNSANQLVSVPVEIDVAVLNVRWFVASFIESDIIRLAGSTNAKQWHGAAPGQAHCKGVEPDEIAPGLIRMEGNWEMTEIGANPQPFDEGHQEIMCIDADGRPIYGANGTVGDRLATPRPLDSDGRFLAPDVEATTFEVDFYEPIDYAALLGI